MTQNILAVGDRVTLRDYNVTGRVYSVRNGEEYGGTLYTVELDDHTFTPDGLYTARPNELISH